MKILTIGGYDDSQASLKEETVEFTKILGQEIIKQGHILVNACMTEFDAIIAQSALETCIELEIENSLDRIIGYIKDGKTPTHNIGRIRRSELKDWELGNPGLKVPEPIETADVVIIVSGFDGAQRAANWARIAKKPILPLVKFEGAGQLIYRQELNNFKSNFNNISFDEFENLSETGASSLELAKIVVNLAERVNVSKNAFVVMSFSDDHELEDAYESFKEVCSKYTPEYVCKRMDEITDVERITPEMLNSIRNCAFVIVDLTKERPNVYYELGYADALNKPLIVTAREGTTIHFDAKDFPILFWKSQKRLKEALASRINNIAVKQGRERIDS